MNKLIYCFLKDIRLSVKGLYFYVEVGMALIFVLVLLFVVPKTPNNDMNVYASVDKQINNSIDISSILEGEGAQITLLDSKEEVVSSLEKNRSAVGLVITMVGEKPQFEYILQGYESDKFKKVIETSIISGLVSKTPGYELKTQVITLGKNLEKLPNRANLLPIFLTMNAAFMGLFIIASYIFLDKEEGTIRALAVTPTKVWQYLFSKIMVMLITGISTSLIVALAIMGFKMNYGIFIIAVTVYNIFGSVLGLFIASFFDSMSKAMGWLYLSIVILGFASVSYFAPAFSPQIIRILPSYPMLFSFREILLKNGDIPSVFKSIVGFAVASVVIFAVTNARFKKTITV